MITLQEELENGGYRPGGYRRFTVKDQKERIISVAPFRDRVVHHAVVGVLEPLYERSFIYDSYATRKEKGTHAAIRRAQGFLRRFRWFLKLDVHKFFDSVEHDVLLGILLRKIKDKSLISLLSGIIRCGGEDGKGLPIGNLTSQFLASVYLDPFDHHIKDGLGVKGYVRYMDDFALFGASGEVLNELKTEAEAFLSARLKLALNPRATSLNRSFHGLSFLGMRIFPDFIRTRPENRRRSLRRLKGYARAWAAGRMEEEEIERRAASIVGHLRYFCPNANLKVEICAP